MTTQAPARPSPGVDFTPGFAAAYTTVPIPAWKRGVDVTAASLGLIFLAPLFAVIALVVMLDSPGAPFYRQVRVGHGGRAFTFWKFRSMRPGADAMLDQLHDRNEANGNIFKMRDDPRVTRVGRWLRKTSLDELPQLWNVLRGDMSLVGPRPPVVAEVLRYEPHQLQRLAAVPGITGLWQVTARDRHDFDDMVRLDIEYAERMSFWLDVRILFKTIPVVLQGKGAC
ncbi:MAG: sugar transferase [Dehalococcoidia bacterium]